MLSEHADRRKAAGIQLTGAKDKAVVEIGPDGVLFRGTFMGRHGFRSGRGERDIDAARIHQADYLFQTLFNVGIRDVGEDIGILSGKLRLAKALHFRVTGKADEVLVRIDDHDFRLWSRVGILEGQEGCVNRRGGNTGQFQASDPARRAIVRLRRGRRVFDPSDRRQKKSLQGPASLEIAR